MVNTEAISVVQLTLLVAGVSTTAGLLYAKREAFGSLDPGSWVAIAGIVTSIAATSVGVYYTSKSIELQEQKLHKKRRKSRK